MMIYRACINLALVLSVAVGGGCSALDLKVGMSLSDERSAQPEVNLDDPLGIIRLEYDTKRDNTVFCEHISSIPQTEQGSGLNHCGVLFKL